MPDPIIVADGSPAATPPPAPGAGQPAEGVKEPDIVRARKKWQAEREQMEAKIRELETAKLSDQEKQVAQAKDETAKQITAQLEANFKRERIDAALKLALAEKQLPANLAPSVSAGAEIENPEDVSAAVDSWIASNTWVGKINAAEPKLVPGQSGSPTQRSNAGPPRPWTQATVNEYARVHGHAELLKHQADILADLGG